VRVLRIRYRLWIEKDGRPVLGKGGAELLRAIKEEGSLSAAARKLGMSYVFAWEYVHRIQTTLGSPVVEARRGGRQGGSTTLTETGEKLLRLYEEAEKAVEQVLRRIMGEVTL